MLALAVVQYFSCELIRVLENVATVNVVSIENRPFEGISHAINCKQVFVVVKCMKLLYAST